MDNLQTLCFPCHNKKTYEDVGKYIEQPDSERRHPRDTTGSAGGSPATGIGITGVLLRFVAVLSVVVIYGNAANVFLFPNPNLIKTGIVFLIPFLSVGYLVKSYLG